MLAIIRTSQPRSSEGKTGMENQRALCSSHHRQHHQHHQLASCDNSGFLIEHRSLGFVQAIPFLWGCSIGRSARRSRCLCVCLEIWAYVDEPWKGISGTYPISTLLPCESVRSALRLFLIRSQIHRYSASKDIGPASRNCHFHWRSAASLSFFSLCSIYIRSH